MNFVLALICLVAAIGLFGYEAVTGDHRFHIRGTNISIGWLLLIMVAYNLVRWWSVRAAQIERASSRAAQSERVRQRARDYNETPRTPDPTFDFTKPANEQVPAPETPPNEGIQKPGGENGAGPAPG